MSRLAESLRTITSRVQSERLIAKFALQASESVPAASLLIKPLIFGREPKRQGGGEFRSHRPPFPPPPKCLHESGGFQKNEGDERRLTKWIQTAARQRVATTTRAPSIS